MKTPGKDKPPRGGEPSGGDPGGLQGRFRLSMEKLLPDFLGKKYVIAFSGGPDSAALLHLCLGLFDRESLLSATLDHAIRKNSAEETEKAVKTARDLGLAAVSERADVPALANERKKGLEEAGRLARYEFLERIRSLYGFDYVLTGNHGDDLAETIVGKIAKGGGPGGLAGALGRSGSVLRPLLPFGKEELLAFLKENSIGYLEDETNRDLKHRRNFIRARVMPELRAINPRIREALGRLSIIAAGDE